MELVNYSIAKWLHFDSGGIKAKNVGDYRAAVGFQPGGHAKQRLRFWEAPEVIGP
jgi:hypothetical protein